MLSVFQSEDARFLSRLQKPKSVTRPRQSPRTRRRKAVFAKGSASFFVPESATREKQKNWQTAAINGSAKRPSGSVRSINVAALQKLNAVFFEFPQLCRWARFAAHSSTRLEFDSSFFLSCVAFLWMRNHDDDERYQAAQTASECERAAKIVASIVEASRFALTPKPSISVWIPIPPKTKVSKHKNVFTTRRGQNPSDL